MKVSDYIVDYLSSCGITTVFGYQGGMITHLVDSISRNTKIRFIQTYHEQSAAIAAEGYARESGKFGVAISTSGPGATNMITGIANAYFDSIPVLYITGQVNSYEYKYKKNLRQQGFQETDIESIAKPITKYIKLVDNPDSVKYELSKAITIATTGRKGPVVLDIPMNIQRADIVPGNQKLFILDGGIAQDYTNKDISLAITTIRNAKCPLVLCGGGIRASNLTALVDNFLQRTGLPYVVSLMGKSAVSESRQLFLGMIGSYGNRDANIILSRADVILVLGSRLDLRQTGNQESASLNSKKFIHVDIDENELAYCKLNNKINIHCSIDEFFEKIGNALDDLVIPKKWISFIEYTKMNYGLSMELKRFIKEPNPYYAIKAIQQIYDEDTIYTVDIGQNQMWAAQALKLEDGQKFYTSGGLAPMGYSLHAAVGVAFASPEKRVCCIIGDGGFHIALQSLMLISQYALNISVFILNNETLGMITQFQELYFNSNLCGTTKDGGYFVPDIKAIAKAYGLSYKKIDHEFHRINTNIRKHQVVNILVGCNTKVCPKLEFNQELDNMVPFLTLEEIERIRHVEF